MSLTDLFKCILFLTKFYRRILKENECLMAHLNPSPEPPSNFQRQYDRFVPNKDTSNFHVIPEYYVYVVNLGTTKQVVADI